MAASTSNLVLNLTTATNNQVAVAPSRGNGDQSDQFSTTLTQQIQARQAEEASYSGNATVNNTSPAPSNSSTSSAGSSSPAPATATNNTGTSASTQAGGESETSNAADGTSTGSAGNASQSTTSTASGASPNSSSGTNQNGKANGKTANNSQGDDQTAQQQAAVANAQLQVYVAQGLQFAQADADASAKDSGLTKAEGLADVISRGDGKGHLHLAADNVDASGADDKASLTDKSTDLAAKLDTERQALPAEQASSHANTSFADMLDQRMQSIDAGVARQQLVTSTGMQRVDTTKSSDGGDPIKGAGTIYEPVGSDGWDHALGNKMVMMVSNDQQEVELQLNPPHLGPMEIKLSLDQNQASVTFVAQHAPVREAIEASMPRLTQMMAESGIQLSQSNVQARSEGNSGQSGQSSRRSSGGTKAIDSQETRVNTGNWRTSMVGGLPGNVNLFV